MRGLLRFRTIPWLMLFEAARTMQSHLGEHLSPADRRRLADVVRRSKGDPRRVSSRERDDLRAIAGRLNLAALGRDLVPTIMRGRRWRRR